MPIYSWATWPVAAPTFKVITPYDPKDCPGLRTRLNFAAEAGQGFRARSAVAKRH